MKKVIFLCLLSLSVCLCKPAEDKASPVPNAPTVDQKVTKAAEITPSQQSLTSPTPSTNVKENVTESKDAKPEPSLPPKQEAANKTSDKPAKEAEVKPAPHNETKVVPEPSKDVKPEEKAKNETTTEKGPSKTTETPKVTETPKPDMHIVEKARGFDGPSFIGGIILTLGLLAIGFMGFKYYKNQTERNYHTL